MFGLKNSIDTTKNHCFYGPIVQRTKTAEWFTEHITIEKLHNQIILVTLQFYKFSYETRTMKNS